MKGILVAGYWILDAGQNCDELTASVQDPESRIKDQFEIDRDDEKIHGETVEKPERRR